MKKVCMGLLFSVIAIALMFGCTTDMNKIKSDMLGIDVAKEAYDEAWSLYVFCNYSGAGDYDPYDWTLADAYMKVAKKAYAKGKGPNFERARVFSLLAIPHLKEVQKKYMESEG